jgi:aspartate aminotransferase
LVERNNGIVEVNGSIPLRSISLKIKGKAMPFFETIELLPEDPILGLTAVYKSDLRDKKVNLGVGIYQDSEGKPYVLNSVIEAEALLNRELPTKGYLPIEGDPEYIAQSLKLLYGNSKLIDEGKIIGAQAVGGCSALRIGGDFLAQELSRIIFISDPSWSNHQGIFSRAGMKIEYYKYYDNVDHRVDFAGLCASIKLMPPASVILLQPCCHNPSGMDLSFDQWKILSDLIHKQRVFPFFDIAYQGFGRDLEEDAMPIRYFVEQGHEMITAQSFSKNFGLYGERVGLISFVTHSKDNAKKILSKIKYIIRETYSNPPLHGAKIVATILKNSSLKIQWMQELQKMRNRLNEMRICLASGLAEKCDRQNFAFLNKQKGMFSFCGLNKQQVRRLQEEKGIYMISNGRINIAGLNFNNLDYVIDSILSVIEP